MPDNGRRKWVSCIAAHKRQKVTVIGFVLGPLVCTGLVTISVKDCKAGNGQLLCDDKRFQQIALSIDGNEMSAETAKIIPAIGQNEPGREIGDILKAFNENHAGREEHLRQVGLQCLMKTRHPGGGLFRLFAGNRTDSVRELLKLE